MVSVARPVPPRATRQWPRHTLVHLHAHAPLAAADDATYGALVRWRSGGHPFIVARASPEDDRDTVRLGVPLPPSQGKARLGCTVAACAIARAQPLPTLDRVATLVDACPDGVAQVAREAARVGLVLRVFGAWAWQALTGLAYVTPASDLDLVARPRDRVELVRLFALARRWDRALGGRLDLEIALPGDEAVAWREWNRIVSVDAGARAAEVEPKLAAPCNGGRVLVKGAAYVALRSLDELVTRLPEAP